MTNVHGKESHKKNETYYITAGLQHKAAAKQKGQTDSFVQVRENRS